MKIKLQFFLYILFAVLATLINISIQKTMNILLTAFNINLLNTAVYNKITVLLLIQMAVATIIAFIFKFLVDKIIIFKNKSSHIKENLRQVVIYGLFAVITTIIFWATELSFKLMFRFANSELVGAVIGLAIGYSLKFLLDRKFVFNS